MRAPAQNFYRPRRVATRKLLSPRTAALFARADEMSGKSSAPLCFLGGNICRCPCQALSIQTNPRMVSGVNKNAIARRVKMHARLARSRGDDRVVIWSLIRPESSPTVMPSHISAPLGARRGWSPRPCTWAPRSHDAHGPLECHVRAPNAGGRLE
jgi:hypothetical protein